MHLNVLEDLISNLRGVFNRGNATVRQKNEYETIGRKFGQLREICEEQQIILRSMLASAHEAGNEAMVENLQQLYAQVSQQEEYLEEGKRISAKIAYD